MVLSSYELLELLEFMPDRGALKTALRQGEFSEEEQVWRHVATELSKLRAITEKVNGGKPKDIRVFPTLSELKEQVQEAEETEERREDFFAFADRSTELGAPVDDLPWDTDSTTGGW